MLCMNKIIAFLPTSVIDAHHLTRHDLHGSSPGAQVIKFFMLNSAEHEIVKAHKYKNIKKLSFIQAQISLEHFFPALKC